MFRTMRRSMQELSREESIDLLKKGTTGVLAVLGDDGYPYSVPLNYILDGDCIWFHCANSGHKLDAIQRDDRVSFCVVGEDRLVPEEYTTYFRSVIVFGRAEICRDEAQKRRAIALLCERFHPTDTVEHREEAIRRDEARLTMVRLQIEHLTGKEARELARRKKECSAPVT